jgi:hypothetical protein
MKNGRAMVGQHNLSQITPIACVRLSADAQGQEDRSGKKKRKEMMRIWGRNV